MPFNYDVMRKFPSDLIHLLPNRLVHLYYFFFMGLLAHCYNVIDNHLLQWILTALGKLEEMLHSPFLIYE